MDCFDLDEEDLAAFQAGSEARFETVYNCYKEKLFRYVLQYVKNPELAYDVVQDAFIRLWEQRSQMVNFENIRGFLFLTAKNNAINLLRRASVDLKAREKILEGYIYPSESDVEYYVIDREYEKYITEVLDRLPEQTKLVFKKCRFENMSYDEVGEELGISRNTVKKHMMRALKVFREDEVIKRMNLNALWIWIIINF
ncbi:RNA polymerase sigma-70 factor [Sphingobacterium faecale]|nr:RNA polymerase sigma-70 factor [Sphingobacterium faecale]